MTRERATPRVGAPALHGREKTALWRQEKLARRKTVFLPGTVIRSSVGTIPMITASAIVRVGKRESVALGFEQVSATSHERIGKALRPFVSEGRIERFGMLVGTRVPFGRLVGRLPRRDNGRLGQVRIAFWLKVEGRARAVILPAVRAMLVGHGVDSVMRPFRIPVAEFFGPVTFWPEEWCFNPLCHAHWHFWPGVPPSTSCHGWCPWMKCQCPVTGTTPPGWAGTCSGFFPCICR